MIAAAVTMPQSSDRQIKIWNAATGREIWSLTGHNTDRIRGIGFGPDGKRLVSAGWDGPIRIWDIESGWELKSIQHGQSRLAAFSYSRDGRYFLTATGSEIKIWGVE
jgi:WD40 repeat protein